jgi:hypothetical protein
MSFIMVSYDNKDFNNFVNRMIGPNLWIYGFRWGFLLKIPMK